MACVSAVFPFPYETLTAVWTGSGCLRVLNEYYRRSEVSAEIGHRRPPFLFQMDIQHFIPNSGFRVAPIRATVLTLPAPARQDAPFTERPQLLLLFWFPQYEGEPRYSRGRCGLCFRRSGAAAS